MRSIEYYCSSYFDPRDAQELSAPQFLKRKILAGKQTIEDLMNVHYMDRDTARINKIVKAAKDWQRQFNEIYGIEEEL